MATEDPRKRAAEEKKLRIDHSDVYLENDKLAEKLEFSLENLSKRRHRQLLSREHEIKQIQQDLNKMKVTKTGALSPATSLRPQTCPATSLHPYSYAAPNLVPAPNPDSAPDHASSSFSPPAFRRLRPAPVIVKLNVRVPPNSRDDSSDAGSDVGENAADGDTSDEEKRVRDRWRRQHQRRWGGKPSVAWGGSERRPSISSRGGGSAREKERPAHEIRRVTKQQLLLHNLDMEAIPSSWFTQVHQPSDVIVRHRAASAHPSSRPAHAAVTSPPVSRKRPASETTKSRLRRTKSALPTAPLSSESELFCGGEQQQQQQQEQLKTEALRSRRQLIELAEGRGQTAAAGGGGAGEEGGRAPRSRINSNRLKFLEAVRIERERLDHRVRLFLRSCDTVTKGGVTTSGNNSNRSRTTEYQIFLPPTLYG